MCLWRARRPTLPLEPSASVGPLLAPVVIFLALMPHEYTYTHAHSLLHRHRHCPPPHLPYTEATWSVLGEAAGRAAVKAWRDHVAVQSINVSELQHELQQAVGMATHCGALHTLSLRHGVRSLPPPPSPAFPLQLPCVPHAAPCRMCLFLAATCRPSPPRTFAPTIAGRDAGLQDMDAVMLGGACHSETHAATPIQ